MRPFPVIYSVLSPDHLVSQVLPHFGIGEISRCRFWSGGFNDTYQVITADDAVYYLRAYRRGWRSFSDIACELDALVHLHRSGIAVARPLPDQSGSLVRKVQAPEGERCLVLFPNAPGEEPSYDQEPERKAFHYGQAVARMHNALDDFTSPASRFHLDLVHLVDQPLANIQPYLSRRPEDWAYLNRFAHKVRQGIEALPAERLAYGFCHGDLQGYHHRIDKDGTMTFIDFDCGGFGFRVYDLAVFRWCGRLSDQEAVWYPPYLAGYQDIRRLDAVDIQAVPLFVCCRYLWHMGVHTKNAYSWGASGVGDTYFDHRLAQLRTLEQDYSLA